MSILILIFNVINIVLTALLGANLWNNVFTIVYPSLPHISALMAYGIMLGLYVFTGRININMYLAAISNKLTRNHKDDELKDYRLSMAIATTINILICYLVYYVIMWLL